MTREDIRKLIGGYATGTLTEAERQLLFEAALDDQELFDELGREQALKEVLEEPGAKSRLIAALARPDPAPVWWKRPMAWVGAGVATAAIAIVALLIPRQAQPVQVAQVQGPSSTSIPAATPPPSEPGNEPAKAGQPSGAPRRAVVKEAMVRGSNVRLEKRADKRDAQGEPTDEKTNDMANDKAKKSEVPVAGGTVAVEAQTSPGPAATPAPRPRQAPVTAIPSAPQDQIQVQAQSQIPASGPSQQGRSLGGVAGGGGGNRIAPAALLARRARFGFDYSIEAGRMLAIRATASGYLSVVPTASKSPQPIFPVSGDGKVAGGSTIRIAIPAEVSSVVIVFSASATGRGDELDKNAISEMKDSRAGTVEDPNPGASSRVVLELKIP